MGYPYSAQPVLVSGANIKTIGGESVLGSGDIDAITGAALQAAIAEYATPVNSVSLILQSANSGGTWGPMDGSALVFLGDVAYLIGGWYGDPANADWIGGDTTNLVYRSNDFGVTWAKIKDHDLTPDSTHFPPGHTMAHCVHTVAGTQYVYLFHGDIQDNWGDVYRSSNGSTWEKVNSTATAYDGTVLMAAGVLNGNIYLAGGCTSLNTANHKRVVYRSTDNGATWTSLGNAPWSARVCNDRLVEHDGKLWLIGGGIYDDALGRAYYNDVWSFDGTTWTQVLANGHDQWEGRYYANTFALGGWLYVSRGIGTGTANLSDTYRSRDGVTWFRVNADLIPSHADSVGVHPSGAVIGPGNGLLLNNTNTNSPTYFLALEGSEDLAEGVETIVRNATANPVTEFSTITVGTFVLSDSSGQILVGEDGSGFYVCSGGVNSSKNLFIGSSATVNTQLYGSRVFVSGALRIGDSTASGKGTNDFFGFNGNPATTGTVHATAFRAYSYQFNSYCAMTWDVNNAIGQFVNTDPGSAIYGGWKWINGTNVKRAELSGLGQMRLEETIVIKPQSSTSLIENDQMTFERVSNTEVRLKMRGRDGVSRSVTLTLS